MSMLRKINMGIILIIHCEVFYLQTDLTFQIAEPKKQDSLHDWYLYKVHTDL